MVIYDGSCQKYKKCRDELVAGLRRNKRMMKDTKWKNRMKAALAELKTDGHKLVDVGQTSARTAALKNMMKKISTQTDFMAAAFLKFMATSTISDANAAVLSNNKLTQYIDDANREMNRLNAEK
jgi:hypothetical protein